MIARIFSISLSLSALVSAACVPVTTPRITAGDLALAQERFSAVPASQVLGFAPEPGTRRTFAVAELQRLARRFSLPEDGLEEICIEVPRQPLDTAALVAAMHSEL